MAHAVEFAYLEPRVALPVQLIVEQPARAPSGERRQRARTRPGAARVADQQFWFNDGRLARTRREKGDLGSRTETKNPA